MLKKKYSTKYSDLNKFCLSEKVKIGEGGDGQVFKVGLTLDKAQLFALKYKSSKNYQQHQDALQEGMIGQGFNHKNLTQILEIYSICSEDLMGKRFETFLFMLLADYSLKAKLLDPNFDRSEKNILFYIKELLEGLIHMKEQNIYHRDIKPENILFFKDVIKLCDYGISKYEDKLVQQTQTTSVKVTTKYCSPKLMQMVDDEVILPHDIEKSDVFSLGITFLQLTLMLKPSDLNGLNRVDKQQKLNDFIEQLNTEDYRALYILLKGMLAFREENRLTFTQCLNLIPGNEPKPIPGKKKEQEKEAQKKEEEKKEEKEEEKEGEGDQEDSGEDDPTKQKNQQNQPKQEQEKEQEKIEFECFNWDKFQKTNPDQYKNATDIRLYLSNNGISDKGAEQIAKALMNNNKLTYLDLNLDSNDISYKGAEQIAKALMNNNKLTTLALDLQNNGISYKGAEQIAKALMNNNKLTTLALGLKNNDINDKGAEQIAKALMNNNKLTLLNLNLDSNDISDKGAEQIAKALMNNNKLTTLALGLNSNSISDKGAEQIAKALMNNNKLTTLALDLDRNNLSEEKLQEIEYLMDELRNRNNK